MLRPPESVENKNDHDLTFNIAGLMQSLAERGAKRLRPTHRCGSQSQVPRVASTWPSGKSAVTLSDFRRDMGIPQIRGVRNHLCARIAALKTMPQPVPNHRLRGTSFPQPVET